MDMAGGAHRIILRVHGGMLARQHTDDTTSNVTFTAARTLAVAFAIVLLAGEAARADCTPAAANNVIATCTGTTTNQGGGAPGTSAGSTGYGNGGATGVTVNVIGGSLSGTIYGILVGDGTVTNNASITGIIRDGINAQTNATVTNNAGASITGGLSGIVANTFADVTNSGRITGTTSGFGIIAWTNATVTNNTGASITGGYGINAVTGFANVTNSASITGTSSFGIHADTNATVTNNAGASIAAAGQLGISPTRALPMLSILAASPPPLPALALRPTRP